MESRSAKVLLVVLSAIVAFPILIGVCAIALVIPILLGVPLLSKTGVNPRYRHPRQSAATPEHFAPNVIRIGVITFDKDSSMANKQGIAKTGVGTEIVRLDKRSDEKVEPLVEADIV